ncbi:MAG: hypothetical protein JXA54_14720, partial [Candidatus Heimdallarchaeota archaeon]|nr:hypothetical protein [Candidatus Heimdallarchaeota archaeon]
YLSCGDLDADGTIEVVLMDYSVKQVLCYDHFGAFEWSYSAYDTLSCTPTLVDLNDDDQLEVIVRDYSNNGTVYCINSTGSLIWHSKIGSTGGFASPVIGDLNNDGTYEIIITSFDNKITFLSHTGEIELQSTISVGNFGWSTPCIFDIDKDGIFEIITGNNWNIECYELSGIIKSGESPWHSIYDSIFNTGCADSDCDFLDDVMEDYFGTTENNNDTDSDLLSDGLEILVYGTDPLITDMDEDDLSDGEEILLYATDPLDDDSDDDLMPDGWEVSNGLNPLLADAWDDPDLDTLINLEEYQINTDPQNNDTDDDGLADNDELAESTNPLDPDSDDDSLLDGAEVYTYLTDPNNPDSDGDSILDGEEVTLGADGFITNPLDADTDGDGIDDATEITNGTDPTDPNDPPTSTPTPSPTPSPTPTESSPLFGSLIGLFTSISLLFGILIFIQQKRRI